MVIIKLAKNYFISFWQEFLKHRPVFILGLVATVLNLGIWISWFVRNRVSHLAFFNPFAKLYIGGSDYGYILPIFAVVILLANFLVSKKLYANNSLMTYILLGATILVEFLIMVLFLFYLKLI